MRPRTALPVEPGAYDRGAALLLSLLCEQRRLRQPAASARSDDEQVGDVAKQALPLHSGRAGVCRSSVGVLGNRPEEQSGTKLGWRSQFVKPEAGKELASGLDLDRGLSVDSAQERPIQHITFITNWTNSMTPLRRGPTVTPVPPMVTVGQFLEKTVVLIEELGTPTDVSQPGGRRYANRCEGCRIRWVGIRCHRGNHSSVLRERLQLDYLDRRSPWVVEADAVQKWVTQCGASMRAAPAGDLVATQGRSRALAASGHETAKIGEIAPQVPRARVLVHRGCSRYARSLRRTRSPGQPEDRQVHRYLGFSATS